MPDAHQGYGLPIGGVLATENAVIPYAVGVDIACRMKLSRLRHPGGGPEAAERAARQRPAARDDVRHRRGVQAAAAARRARRGLVGHADHRSASSTRPARSSAPAAAATTSSSSACSRSTSPTSASSPAQYLALLSHSGSRGAGRDGRRLLLAARDGPPPRAAAGAEAPRLARHGHRAGPGVLGRDEPDGQVRRGQPRDDPPEGRARRSARRCSPASRTTTTSRGRRRTAARR